MGRRFSESLDRIPSRIRERRSMTRTDWCDLLVAGEVGHGDRPAVTGDERSAPTRSGQTVLGQGKGGSWPFLESGADTMAAACQRWSERPATANWWTSRDRSPSTDILVARSAGRRLDTAPQHCTPARRPGAHRPHRERFVETSCIDLAPLSGCPWPCSSWRG